ncbi:dehydrogenase, partial [Fomitiporia mediterranea MF3/22]|uniref:dehydrogenase n=1 Tax=Fomitiporia mediterranea (strain MF3/22) TaxID=694068 RepID=UPI00044082F6
GIGRATAIALSAHNWRLVLTARSQSGLEETAKLCTGLPPYIVAGDVADEQTVVTVFEAAKREYGRLDLLFNNAGIGTLGVPMEELPVSKFQDVINTNITGTFLCTREAFKMFKSQDPQGGRVINNGSISAHTPRPHSIAYTASKHAITGLTKSTALDGRAFNIACTQIDIGNALTNLAAQLEQGTLQPNGEVKPEAVMDVKHVADTIVHIASLPNEVSVLEMTIMATGMPFVGRG